MNEARAKQGLEPLERDSSLEVIALVRAEDLIENPYFDHYAPNGSSA